MDATGRHSLKEPYCFNPRSPRHGHHVTADDTCESFIPWTGDEDDPLVPTEH